MARKKLDDAQPIELTVENDKPMASSLQVAKHFGKRHADVLRSIEAIKKEAPEDWCERNFAFISNITELGHAERNDPAYMMTRDGFTFLAMGFTGKRAIKWKISYIDAFSAMERTLIRAQGKPEPLKLPSESEDQRRERGLVIIKALLKFWSVSDGISIDIATRILCSALKITGLEEFTMDHFSPAWSFVLRTFFMTPSSEGTQSENSQLEENVLQVVEEMLNALMQFKSSRLSDTRKIFYEACSLTPELFMKADTAKMPIIIWGVFQFWYGYTLSALRSESIE